jgi:hypothetical protein
VRAILAHPVAGSQSGPPTLQARNYFQSPSSAQTHRVPSAWRRIKIG